MRTAAAQPPAASRRALVPVCTRQLLRALSGKLRACARQAASGGDATYGIRLFISIMCVPAVMAPVYGKQQP